MDASITVERTELYEWVWSEPITKLATRLGVRYVDLVQACSILNVPRPSQGYWGKLQRGLEVSKSPLPVESAQDRMDIQKASTRKRKLNISGAKLAGATEGDRSPEPKPLRHLPMVSRIKKALEDRHECTYGLRHVCDRSRGLHIAVARKSVPRLLAFCDSLFRACKAQGISVGGSKNIDDLVFDYGKDRFSFKIRERSSRRDATPEDRQSSFRDYVYTPTGLFTFEFRSESSWSVGPSWADTKGERLERYLPEIVAAIPPLAAKLKRERLERENQKRRDAYNQEQREKLDARIDAETERRTKLECISTHWQRAESMRAFCAEVERRSASELSGATDGCQRDWLAWARAVADWKDPFKDGRLEQLMQEETFEPELDCKMKTY